MRVGSNDAGNPAMILNGRYHGRRASSARCQVDSSTASAPGRGEAFYLHPGPRNSRFESNVVFNVPSGFSAPPVTATSYADWSDVFVLNNIVDLYAGPDLSAVVTGRRFLDLDLQCSGSCSNPPGRSVRANYNWFGYAPTTPDMAAVTALLSTSSEVSVQCNIARGSGFTVLGAATGQGNVGVQGASWAGAPALTDTLAITEAQAAGAPFCFWTRLQTDAPVRQCIDNVYRTSASAHSGHGNC